MVTKFPENASYPLRDVDCLRSNRMLTQLLGIVLLGIVLFGMVSLEWYSLE